MNRENYFIEKFVKFQGWHYHFILWSKVCFSA